MPTLPVKITCGNCITQELNGMTNKGEKMRVVWSMRPDAKSRISMFIRNFTLSLFIEYVPPGQYRSHRIVYLVVTSWKLTI